MTLPLSDAQDDPDNFYHGSKCQCQECQEDAQKESSNAE